MSCLQCKTKASSGRQLERCKEIRSTQRAQHASSQENIQLPRMGPYHAVLPPAETWNMHDSRVQPARKHALSQDRNYTARSTPARPPIAAPNIAMPCTTTHILPAHTWEVVFDGVLQRGVEPVSIGRPAAVHVTRQPHPRLAVHLDAAHACTAV